MAISQSKSSLVHSISLFISLLSLSLSLAISNPDHPSNSNPINGSPDIHDILPNYNIPKGILPNAVKSYTLSSEDGSFVVTMEHPCYVRFDEDQLVYYDKVIEGKLSYGKISHVSGIQAKKLFIWLSVTGLDIDSDSAMVEFHVGALTQKLPSLQFQTIPTCIPQMDQNLPLLNLGHFGSFFSRILFNHPKSDPK